MHGIGALELGELVMHRHRLIGSIPAAANQILDGAGLDVDDVALLDTDVRVGPALLRLLA